jgi:nitrite reductase/ring-hydroxylating ferredoxin subunit
MRGVTPENAVQIMAIPDGLRAAGTADAPFEPVATLDELPLGTTRRVTRADLDVLLVHSESGLCAIDDRCPHMAAPLSLGALDGCVIGCPLHKGRFDLCTGDVVQFPTTGGLDADGGYHPPWSPPDSAPRVEPTDLKAQARALTRIRRLRYYPLRLNGSTIEIRFPR